MPLYVSQPLLPPLKEFIPYLEKIWDSKILTNGGPMHMAFEQALCNYLGVQYISLFSNATLALITALKALKIDGEVITTPYSFVATAHSLLWNDINPVFVDIDRISLNIDPNKIEAAITSKTKAIMPVHCYGNPCDVDRIESIAKKFNLKVIYDAAHAFGVKCHCGSILNHGDLSVLSFHATKVFNTFEGGAIISHSLEMKNHIDQLKNFGFVNEVTVVECGINAKMSEINSAFGLLQLNYIDDSIKKRSIVDFKYRNAFLNISGIECISNVSQLESNYSYFPILVQEEYPLSRDELYNKLKFNEIFARRYFYPLISEFPMYNEYSSAKRGNLPVAYEISNKVICLPIHPHLDEFMTDKIINLISNPTY